jgi:hypothetical protein
MNNIWNPTGAGTQCISWSGTTLSVTSTNFSNTGAAPSSYPAFVRGCHFGNCSSGWTAKQVSAIGSAPSTFSVTPSTAGGPWDIAYDIWLDPTNNNSGQQTGLELMIWLDYTGAQPSGSQIGTATIDGQTWEVRATRMSSWNYVAYRAKGLRSVNIDVKHFLSDVIANRKVNGQAAASAAWFLTSIQAGTEIWQGGSGFSATFSAAVN